jgi:oxygen-independent coproporphyrinogen III oxidase
MRNSGSPPMTELLDRLHAAPYQGYSYSYPHKSAYRALPQPVDLATLWQGEDRSALFGYIHIPFCTYRCGFCNLFALGQPGAALVEDYLRQLDCQLRISGELLGERRFARFAVGGGTPSYLSAAQLARLFTSVREYLAPNLGVIPCGIEVSPETATRERLAECRAAGVDRVSMGVQSFVDTELQALVRPAQTRAVLDAVEQVRALGFPTLNLDLIYGIPGQTAASFAASLRTLIALQPEEIYLYPLYVRERTGLGRLQRGAAAPAVDPRRALYELGRDSLLAAGYTQVSLRLFRAAHAPENGGPAYCCQDDGMIGLGCGARSYTRALHYSDRYAVERAGVTSILRDYIAQPISAFASARYGFVLDAQEQRRRYLIQSLLTWPGLDTAAFARRFGLAAQDCFSELAELQQAGLAEQRGAHFALTALGMAHADAIGPWLNSAAVQARVHDHDAAA